MPAAGPPEGAAAPWRHSGRGRGQVRL